MLHGFDKLWSHGSMAERPFFLAPRTQRFQQRRKKALAEVSSFLHVSWASLEASLTWAELSGQCLAPSSSKGQEDHQACAFRCAVQRARKRTGVQDASAVSCCGGHQAAGPLLKHFQTPHVLRHAQRPLDAGRLECLGAAVEAGSCGLRSPGVVTTALRLIPFFTCPCSLCRTRDLQDLCLT